MFPKQPSDHPPLREHAGPNAETILEKADRELMLRIFEECHSHIIAASTDSPIPPELLAGLTANESGGNAQARRFEPGVFEHLKSVAEGRATQFGAIRARDLEQAERILEVVKSPEYHARFLNTVFAATHALSISELQEDALRAFASSWGYTQVMGYHMIGRQGSVQDLCDPTRHFIYAIDLLNDFIRQFRLNAIKDFESLLHCWNSGGPRGKTFDPAYVPNGLRRAALYRELMLERKASGISQATGQRRPSQTGENPAPRNLNDY
ncbi:MAG: hypothetical protein ACRD2O_13885 [Terriglobia bacterium]